MEMGSSTTFPTLPAKISRDRSAGRQFNNGIFRSQDFPAPAAGAEGNFKRNIYRNPGNVQLDSSVLKNTHVPWFGEAGNLQFRFDFLNVFNHVNLGPVSNNLARGQRFRPGYFRPSCTAVQLAVRVAF